MAARTVPELWFEKLASVVSLIFSENNYEQMHPKFENCKKELND